MCLLSPFKFGIFFLPLCRCFFVEISLSDKNESKIIKLVCGPPDENRNLRGNHTVLWHGSQFGVDEQQKLTESMQTDALVPNISISSSKRHRCYLLTSEDTYKSLVPQKKRVSRENSEASIPADNGNCPPGYRIAQDRCFACFPGSYTSGQDSVCYLCPKDFYIDKRAADACWPCPGGKKTLAQGADSEESCVYFDESGHPTTAEGPPWILIFSLVGVIIAFVWVIIIILFVRYWKNRDDTDQSEIVERRSDSRSSKPLLTSGSHASLHSDPEDHIYAEIGDFVDEDTYEVPRKPTSPPEYVDIVPDIPEKRPRKHSTDVKQDSSEDHFYERPIKKSSEHAYEEPIPKDHLYERPIKKSSEHAYEEPIPKRSDSHSYEIPIKKSSKRSESRSKNMDDFPSMYPGNESAEDLPPKNSTSFEPYSSAILPDVSSKSRMWRKSRQSGSSRLVKSDERMSFGPEGNIYDMLPEEGNMYDMPPEEEENMYDTPTEE